ncbi:RNA polymerase factor sigma-54 [Metabacillus arenae]|uniref:RNA polymerase factor sigma-54 n=1 Tax=Metabacillus arenae TaxID=2771434 RepID=A0A926NT93_9BACI|nr:RNA polymerase factor sigma-54 [Metabacillus arenae]MBD1383526.1 RNA polymerase factor sigma-54 [Metabacillus arenae]
MNYKVGLFQEQTLKLNMTQELKQAITLLQYSAIELSEYVQNLALENPLIEMKERDDTSVFYHKSTGTRTSNQENSVIENVSSKQIGLRDHIKMQLIDLEKTPKALMLLIEDLDQNGYLKDDLSVLACRFNLEEDEMVRQLEFLQSLDPAGIGARNLQECLCLQLKRRSNRNELAEYIIANHFELFAKKSWRELARKTKISVEEIQKIHDLVKTLDPRPGILYDATPPAYIEPDLYVRIIDGKLNVLYNDRMLPELKINSQYESFLKPSSDTELKSYLSSKWQQCNWLFKSIEQRKATMVNVMNVMIAHQREFFYQGSSNIKPLTLKMIAEQLGIHESTVSRAVKDKFVQTPQGLFEMRYFFSAKIEQAQAEDLSSNAVKQLIQKYTKEENKQKPLSDQAITKLLKKEHNMSVSRRTIAKYRDQLNIPSSTLRKRFS